MGKKWAPFKQGALGGWWEKKRKREFHIFQRGRKISLAGRGAGGLDGRGSGKGENLLPG